MNSSKSKVSFIGKNDVVYTTIQEVINLLIEELKVKIDNYTIIANNIDKRNISDKLKLQIIAMLLNEYEHLKK